MTRFLKTGFKLFIGLVGICIVVFFLIFVGSGLASVVYPSNQFLAILVFIVLSIFFGYLIIRAEIKGNDGLDPISVAVMSSWIYAAIATAMIFIMILISSFFLIINLVIFLIITTILAFRIQRNPSNYYIKTWDESGRRIKLDDAGKKMRIKKSVFLARNTLDVYSLAGLFTGIIAFVLYRLGIA